MRIPHLLPALVVLLGTRAATADVGSFSTTHTFYHESPFRSNMTVYSPSVDASAKPIEALELRAGWEADIVSGASVAVKAGPDYAAINPGVDVVTTASVYDVRNVGRGGFTVRKDTVTWSGNYAFSTENDYRSHSFDVSAKSEFFEHNTSFEISYARNIDTVCDRMQGPNDLPARHRALESSTGCFVGSDPLRAQRGFGSDSFQGTWVQAWTPVLSTQLIYTAQIGNGFQSNPYRSVILGAGVKAQEHHPENRSRHSVAARANWFLRPIKAALKFGARGYIDSWDVKSITGEVEFEKLLGEKVRLLARVRYYRQSGALFFSDDYTGGDRPRGPKGQYFTGDRELSPFSSYLGGARITYAVAPDKKKVLGFLTSVKLSGSFDLIHFDYDEFTLGGATISNARAYIAGLSLDATF